MSVILKPAVKPKKAAGDLILTRKKHENKLYDLYDYVDKHEYFVGFVDVLWDMRDKIESELGEKFREKIASVGMYDTMRFLCILQ